MLQLIGSALLLLGSTWAGLSAVRRLERRVTGLRALTDALELMERELDFRLPPMKELILKTARQSQEPAARFFCACARELDQRQDRPLAESWELAVLHELSDLKNCDLDVLRSLGPVLGRYDSEGQRQAIAAARSRLAHCLTDAAEERRRQGKVYGTLGVAAGAFLVLLML